MRYVWIAFLGVLFGVVLSRSGAADYGYIQGMFLLTDLQLYGILASGVLMTGLGLRLLRAYGRTVSGHAITIKPKAVHRGNLVGGALFGVGWALTGMCPGPVMVNMGEGKLYALAAFAGVLVGTWLVGRFHPWLSRTLGLASVTAEPAAAEPSGA